MEQLTEIANLTGVKFDTVIKFIIGHGLNLDKLHQAVKESSGTRIDLLCAIAGYQDERNEFLTDIKTTFKN